MRNKHQQCQPATTSFWVKRVASNAGYRLRNFQCGDGMELYYDIWKGNRDVGYITKGESDPGVRVANILFTILPRYLVVAIVESLSEFCATNGVSITVSGDANRREVTLEYVLYSAGFNTRTFAAAMDTFAEVMDKVRGRMGVAERSNDSIYSPSFERWYQ